MITLFILLVVVVQTYKLLHWILTKLHLTAEYRQDTKTIVRDLGYTMAQYSNNSHVQYLVTQEWLERIKR